MLHFFYNRSLLLLVTIKTSAHLHQNIWPEKMGIWFTLEPIKSVYNHLKRLYATYLFQRLLKFFQICHNRFVGFFLPENIKNIVHNIYPTMAKDIYLQCVQIRPSCYRALYIYIYVTKKMGKYIIIIQKITFFKN